ncbi:MAG: hypothetical protein N2662_09860 [Bacteroidales bacterium]|nr:hypothetical protein [Bacteroidales bacterium]
MDNLQINSATSGFELNEMSVKYLTSIYRWTYFFSILGFVGIVLLLLLALFAKAMINAMNPQLEDSASMMAIVYLLMALIYVFPVWYMFRFSKLAKQAILDKNTLLMQEALKNFKMHFQFVGIVTISILVLYFVIIVGFVLGKIFLG